MILIIVFVALGIYYPAIFGEVNNLDDEDMMTNVINVQQIDWGRLFFPGSSFHYYRPVLHLSFLFDRFVFGSSSVFLHFNNILLHTINGVLVFLIVRQLIQTFRSSVSSYVPLMASLLFVLHPINTEPVNFISGRTDVLAGVFVLGSFLVFLRWGLRSFLWSWVAAALYLLGLLSKEVAAGLLPVVGYFLVLKEEQVTAVPLRRRILLFLPFVVMTAAYFAMRSVASGQADVGVLAAVGAGERVDLLVRASSGLKAFGFYLKKLFIPLPLNFAIVDIDRTFYLWFGLAAMIGITVLASLWRRVPLFLFLFAVLFFLPALPVAFAKIAWTPLAERYLYISSAGMSALIAFMILGKQEHDVRRQAVMCALLVAAAVITTDRNIVWQSNLTLYEDTVRKSPACAGARNQYGIALVRKGRLEEADQQFRLAQETVGTVRYAETPALNRAALAGIHEGTQRAREEYRKILKEQLPPEALERTLVMLIKATNEQIIGEEDRGKRRQLCHENISYMIQLISLRESGFHHYRIGQLYLAVEDKDRARYHFRRAVDLAPNEYFSGAAKKLMERLDAATT